MELKSHSAKVTIFPELAGMINNFIVDQGSGPVDLIFGYDNLEHAKKEIGNDFRSTKLSPFPNRINDGKYTFENQEFQLPVNFPNEGHSIHGLLYDREFKLVEHSDSHLELEYVYDSSIDGYPFTYIIRLGFELSGANLKCSTYIKNTGNAAMPIGDGFHPYFAIGPNVGDLSMKMPPVELVEVNDRMIPTGESSNYDSFLNQTLIADTELDTCFKINSENGIASTTLTNTSSKIELTLWQETGKDRYNFLQIYTPPHRKCIALEPMTCAPDVLNNHNGLIILGSGEEIKMSYGMTVKSL